MLYINKAVRAVEQFLESKFAPRSTQSTFPTPSQIGRLMLGCPERKSAQQNFLGNQK
jgi:hypothetical protein